MRFYCTLKCDSRKSCKFYVADLKKEAVRSPKRWYLGQPTSPHCVENQKTNLGML